jgi:uncharacterized membrane protein
MVGIGASVGLISLLVVAASLAIPIAIVWLIVVLVRSATGANSRPRYDPAAEQLRYRYARGEISQAEFEQGMHVLGYERRS